MLEPEPPFKRSARWYGGNRFPSASGTEPIGCKLQIAAGRRKPDATWVITDEASKSGEEADNLIPPVLTDEGVYFVDYNVFESAEKSRYIIRAIDNHRFKRFGSYLEYALRLLQQL